MCGWHIKLCDPLVTHRPYLSALEMQRYEVLYKFLLLYFTLYFDAFRWMSDKSGGGGGVASSR